MPYNRIHSNNMGSIWSKPAVKTTSNNVNLYTTTSAATSNLRGNMIQNCQRKGGGGCRGCRFK